MHARVTVAPRINPAETKALGRAKKPDPITRFLRRKGHQRDMDVWMVTHIARVRTNRVRLPILLVVS